MEVPQHIRFFYETEEFSWDENAVSTWITAFLKHRNEHLGELRVIFCDDEQLLEINRQYLQHDYYTDSN